MVLRKEILLGFGLIGLLGAGTAFASETAWEALRVAPTDLNFSNCEYQIRGDGSRDHGRMDSYSIQWRVENGEVLMTLPAPSDRLNPQTDTVLSFPDVDLKSYPFLTKDKKDVSLKSYSTRLAFSNRTVVGVYNDWLLAGEGDMLTHNTRIKQVLYVELNDQGAGKRIHLHGSVVAREGIFNSTFSEVDLKCGGTIPAYLKTPGVLWPDHF
jgi:hypothetical protein